MPVYTQRALRLRLEQHLVPDQNSGDQTIGF